MAVKTIVVKLEALVSQYRAKMAEATRSTHLFSAATLESAKKNKQAFTELGLVAVAFGGAIVFALGMAADKALEFESNLTSMVTLAGVAADEAHHLGEAVLEMGETGRGAIELSDALYYVVSSGQQGAQALRTVEASAKAAAIGLGTTMEVADAVTSAMNAYGESALSASLTTDILAAGVKFGKIEANELAPVLGNLVGIANSLSISFADVVGTMAVLSRVGVDASEGATMLSGVMSTILSNSPQVIAALDTVGLSMADLRAEASENGLIAAMRMLQESFGGNVEAMRTVVPNIRAFRAVMNALSQDAELVDDVLLGVNEAAGTVSKGFAEWSDTAEGAKARMGAAFENLAITFGMVLLPAIEFVSNAATGLFDLFRSIPGPLKTVVVVLMAVTAAAALFGGALLLLLPRIAATKTAMLDLAGTSKLTGGALKMGAAMLNPWTIGITLGLTALTMWSAAKAEAKRATEEFTSAIEADTGAIGANTQATIINRLEQDGLLEAYADAGMSAEDLTDNITALGDAYQAKDAETIKAIMTELQAVDVADQHKINLYQLIDAMTSGADAATRKAEAEGKHAGAEGEAADATGKNAQAQFDLGEALEENISFADELTAALEALAGVQLDAAKAELEWEEALDELSKGLKGGADALDNRNEKGRENLKLIHSGIDAAFEHGAAVAEETGSVQKGAKAVQSHIAALVDEAAKAGIARDKINAYIRELNLTPKQIKTIIEMNTGPAQSALDMFIRNAEGRIIGLTAHLTADISPGHTKHAGGVIGESGARRMHGGGEIRSNEELIIAEHGERVVTAKKYAALQSAAAQGARIRPETNSGGATVVNVGVRLDRRRFNKELEHDTEYDGRWAS